MIAVILTTDAQPIPLSNTYVVPVRGNVTFTCSSSSGGGQLVWTVNVTINMKYTRITSSTIGLKDRPGFSVSDESTVNTASFTFQNISLESNPSPVKCHDLSITDESKDRAVLMIIVEGEFSTAIFAQAKLMYNISTLSKTMQVCT